MYGFLLVMEQMASLLEVLSSHLVAKLRGSIEGLIFFYRRFALPCFGRLFRRTSVQLMAVHRMYALHELGANIAISVCFP